MRYGMVWCGIVSYRMVRCGMVWYDMVWYVVLSLPGEWPLVLHVCCVVRSRRQGSGQEAVQWHGSRHSVVYGAVLWYGMVVVWCGMVWYGMVWYGASMVCYGGRLLTIAASDALRSALDRASATRQSLQAGL